MIGRRKAEPEGPKLDKATRDWFRQEVTIPSLIPGMPAMDEAGQPIRRTRFEALKCQFCGGWHAGACRRVKEITYHQNGEVKRAVFREDWTDDDVIYAHDIDPMGDDE